MVTANDGVAVYSRVYLQSVTESSRALTPAMLLLPDRSQEDMRYHPILESHAAYNNR